MLSTLLLAANLLTIEPKQDLAFDPRDDSQEYKDQLNTEYPGLENFWGTDVQGIMYKGTAKVAIVLGQIDGDFGERAV